MNVSVEPPADILAEQSVLGALLLGGSTLVERTVETLRPLDFYREGHGAIYEAMIAIARRYHTLDIVTLRAEMSDRGTLEGVGGMGYLMSLADIVPTTSGLTHYAERVATCAMRRRLYWAGVEISQLAISGGSEEEDVAESAEQRVLEATRDRRGGDTYQTMPVLVTDALAEVEEAMRLGGGLAGIGTGLTQYDNLIGGYTPGQLHIVAGRPGMGKSVFAATVAVNVATTGASVAIFTSEMSGRSYIKRVVASLARIDYRSLRTGRLTPEQFRQACQHGAEAAQLPIYVDDTSSITPSAITSRVRKMCADHGQVDLIIVDYLQRLQPDVVRKNGTQAEEITKIAQALKTMAGTLGIPVLALAQPNRNMESRQDKRPVLSDLADSSGIEKEADSVSFLYRPAYYATDNDPQPYEESEIIVAKQREGPQGTVKVLFSGPYQRFDNLSEREEDIH